MILDLNFMDHPNSTPKTRDVQLTPERVEWDKVFAPTNEAHIILPLNCLKN